MVAASVTPERETMLANEGLSVRKKRAREGLQYLLEPNLQAFPLWGG